MKVRELVEETIREDIKEMLKVGFTEKTKGGTNVMKRQLRRIYKKYPSFPQEEIRVLSIKADNETWASLMATIKYNKAKSLDRS